ncbi:MAG: MFS transporter [Deltaproteobacteria bacterium]|nr:MFS transporter [Deltaproteobacteria bacterium]
MDSPPAQTGSSAQLRGNPFSRWLVRTGIYYGWTMTLVAFVCGLWSIGFIFYTYGIFREPIRHDLGWNVSTLTAAYAGYTILMAIWGPAAARLTERYGSRQIVLAGTFILPVAMVGISFARTEFQFFIAFSVLASLGTAFLGMIPNYAALNQWFTANKAQSFSWASAGISSAGMTLVPFTQYLLNHYGWREAYRINAALLVITVLPLVLLTFYDRPSDLGVPEETPPPADPDAEPDRLMEFREIAFDKRFILSVLSLSLASACWSVILQSFVSDLSTRDTGYRWTQGDAATLYTCMAVLCAIGKPIFGALGDRMERRRAIIFAVSMQVAGFVLITVTRWATLVPFSFLGVPVDLLLVSGVLLYGLGVGGTLPLFSALHADQFGRLSFPRVSGLATPFNVAIISVMYLVTGAMYDRYLSYLPQGWLMLAAYAVSIGAILILLIRVKRPRNPRRTFETPLERAEPV